MAEVWIKAYGNLILKKRCYIAGLNAGARSVIVDDRGLLKLGSYRRVTEKSKIPAVTVKCSKDIGRAERYLGKVPMLIVESNDAALIKSMISSAEDTSVLVTARTAEDVLPLMDLLRNTDGILADSGDPDEIKKIMDAAGCGTLDSSADIEYLEDAEDGMSIGDLRSIIDAIDERIMELIAKRLDAAKLIGRIKHAEGIGVTDERRESAVIEKYREFAISNGTDADILEDVCRTLMAGSRKIQNAGNEK